MQQVPWSSCWPKLGTGKRPASMTGVMAYLWQYALEALNLTRVPVHEVLPVLPRPPQILYWRRIHIWK